MAKIINQKDLLMNHVMEGGYKSVNTVGATSGYAKLILKGKEKDGSMSPVDFVEVHGVPFMAKTDTEVTMTSSTDVQRIEVEYPKDEAERRKKALVDSFSMVDVVAMRADTAQLTPAVELTRPSAVMPAVPEIPLTTLIGDVITFDDDREIDTPVTYRKKLEALEDAMFKVIEDLEGDFVQVATKASLYDTSMIGSSGSQPTE
ncbi:hypothetical protein MTR67_002668 [Solanum verrucosum]|uniref:Uncharacterized protein n=1 Tax=Solanum verrucosum TaxID=315347 RepID=A0AAF0PQK9_SOLVR|nr:hypothetical protein MTR67_002668 [Solanum verrucosum]